MAVAVTWAVVSHWILGVPLDVIIRARRAGSPARSKVVDVFGHPHFVMVEPHDPDTIMSEGDTVLLVRREGETFFAVHYESPKLQLD